MRTLLVRSVCREVFLVYYLAGFLSRAISIGDHDFAKIAVAPYESPMHAGRPAGSSLCMGRRTAHATPPSL